jgi:outer membrane protein TolC
MMRGKELLVLVAIICGVTVGCKQECFRQEPDDKYYLKDLVPLPAKLETDRNVAIIPLGVDVPKPATVDDAERPPRYLTLAECFAIAIEQGKVGVPNPRTAGIADDTLTNFTGASVTLSDGIRVFALQPAAIGTTIEQSLSKFDAQWITSMNWTHTDEPTGGNFVQSFSNGESANFTTQLIKPLPTGGVAAVTFTDAYTLLSQPPAGVTNPTYRPTLQFNFEQPLLQGFGVEINQLRTAHPGSLLTPFQQLATNVEGILITRIRFDEARSDFAKNVEYMLYNVETAYWNLFDSYWALYSREQGLRQAYEAWRINRDRLEAGRISRQDLAQTRQQYELFRGQRIIALDTVLENERQLRALLGMPVEDGYRLVPIDKPTLTRFAPDWRLSLNEALVRRPELITARNDLKFWQLNLIAQKNTLLPDLRLTSSYGLNGLGTTMDGGPGNPNNAFASLASDKFTNWAIGLRMTVPLGFRQAEAVVRQARLNLAQSYLSLRDMELRTQSFLDFSFRQISTNYENIIAQRAQREAAGIALEARLKEYLAGRIILDVLLQAQLTWANALQTEYDAISQYNISLARFEFAKGTLMQRDNVAVAEGSLPACAQERAVDHEKERALGLVLLERANPVQHTPCSYADASPGLPKLPANEAPSIPSLFEGAHEAAPGQQSRSDSTTSTPAAPKTAPTVWNGMPPSTLGTSSTATGGSNTGSDSAVLPAAAIQYQGTNRDRVDQQPTADGTTSAPGGSASTSGSPSGTNGENSGRQPHLIWGPGGGG